MPKVKKDPASPPWTIYIIESRSGKLYTGITTDLDRRFKQHEGGKQGARFFKISPPAKVVYTESASNRSEASQREAAIKRLSRQQKLEMIGA